MQKADGSLLISVKTDTGGIKKGKGQIESSLKGLTSTVNRLGAAVGLAFGIGAIISFGKASIKASTDIENAMTGLKSIVEGQGRSFAQAEGFIKKYISDGLIPATQAVTAYKNLAMRGYTDVQIETTLQALKDSAAFGRQASLSMGEAVSSATEGLKNENSILVDNAGVTKNVSMMWKDYAKSIGVGVDSLTKQQRIQAEVVGIMQETRFQTGDAARVADTYSGAVLKLAFVFNDLKIAVGNFIKPIAQLVIPILSTAIQQITVFINTLSRITGALFGNQSKGAEQAKKQQTAIGGSVKNENALAKATGKAAKESEKQLAGFDEIQKLSKETAGNEAEGAENIGAVGGGGTVFGENMGINVSGNTAGVISFVEDAKRLFSEFIGWISTNITPSLNGIWTGFSESANMVLNDIISLYIMPWWETFKTIMLPMAGEVAEELFSTFATYFGEIKKNFDLVWQTGFAPALNLLVEIWQDMWESIDAFWQKWGVPIFENVRIAFENMGEIFRSMWENFLQPIWETFMENVDWLWSEHLKPLLDNFLDFVGELINGALRIYNEFIAPLAKWFWDVFGESFSLLFQNALNVVSTIIASIVDVVNGVITVLKGIVQFIVGVFTGDWSKAWEGVKDIFKGVWDAFVGIVKMPINLIIDLVNGMVSAVVDGVNVMIRALNSLSFDVPYWVPFIGGETFGFDISELKAPKIPRLAQGGVLPPNREFMAVLGDQKHGTNIEAPMSTIKQGVREVLQEMGSLSGAKEVTEIYNLNETELMRVIYKLANGGKTLKGMSLKTSGAF